MHTKRRILFEHWYLCLALVWQELVLKVSTTGEFWPEGLFVLLFSLALGQLARLLLSLLPSRRANKIAKVVLLALVGLVFCVEYFVFREFKVFYDVITVTMGAGDAAKGFGNQAMTLVLSPTGILHIVLFMAPAIVYAILGRGERLEEDEDTKPLVSRGAMLRDTAVLYASALLLVAFTGNFAHSYTDRYSFQTSVTNFGLVTSLRKEAVALATGSQSKIKFKQTTIDTHRKQDDGSKAKKAYSPNVMDIDFEELASTTDGVWADLDNYVASLQPSSKNVMTGRFSGYNLIFVSAEALSAEAIRPDTTPTLFRMATKGIQFLDYYQFDSAGTTGGECGNLLGLLPTEGGDSVKITADHNNYFTMGNALSRLNYNGWAFHNNTYTYYSRDLTHNNLGYSNGYMGYGNGMEEWVDWDWPESDLQMMQGTFDNIYGSKENEPFNVYYMSVSGHSDYGPGANHQADKNWDLVEDLDYSDPVKGYLASHVDLDRGLEYLVQQLEKEGLADHTAFVISADHFPYGLDDDGPLGSLPYTSELYGYDVATSFERDHNRLIIWTPSLEKAKPLVVDTPTSTIDILPTLLNLFGCEWDSRLLPGRDVFSDKAPLVMNLAYDWKTDLGTYYAGSDEFIPVEGAEIPEGYVEGISNDVSNRINYCRGVLTSDYYQHVFG